MNINNILSSKKIGILGFGKEGQEFEKYLKNKNFSGEIFIFDKNFLELEKNFGEKFKGKKIFFTNSKNFSDLKNCDFYFKSPGISRWIFSEIQKKFEEGKIFSGTEIFLEEIKNSNSKIIGITGTKGKSTISSLIHHFLKLKFPEENGENKVELLGNIGVPALNYLNNLFSKPRQVQNIPLHNLNKIFILELSSYQIEDLNPEKKLDFGLLLNIFPDHLDYHKGFENYKKSKEKILEISEKIFIGTEKKFLEDKKFFEKFLDKKKIKLKGNHNKNNILFVSKFLIENFGFSKIEIKKGIEKFQPLKHRMEEFRHLNRLWINDAISTTPDSTIECLKTYQNRINGIILGGQDRGYDFENLIEFTTKIPNLKAIAIFENCPNILDLIEEKFFNTKKIKNNKTNYFLNFLKQVLFAKPALDLKNLENNSSEKKPKIFISNDLEKITKFLFENSEKQGVITLSTASPSYGYFKNFEEQGNIFLESIKKI